MQRFDSFRRLGFTLLEVILIVAIIGMMMLMIIGYLLAPKNEGALPPIEERKLIPGASSPAPAATPAPVATPAPAATPLKPIDLAPGAVPAFR